MIRDREGDLPSTELQKSKHLRYSFGVKRSGRPCTCRSSSAQRFTEFEIYFLRNTGHLLPEERNMFMKKLWLFLRSNIKAVGNSDSLQ